MPVRRLLFALLLLGGLLPGHALPAQARPAAGTPAAAVDRSGRCGLLMEIVLPGGKFACTHGADPAPEGVDIKQEFDPDAARAKTGLLLPDPLTEPNTPVEAASGNPCYGDGQSGNRVQAIYARPADRADRYARVLPFIRKWAGEVDILLNASARDVGGATRHVRYVTNASCEVAVDHVVLSSNGDLNLGTTMAEMALLGYNRPDRKYLVWMDAIQLCGIAAYYPDDRATRDNLNNGIPEAAGVVARIDSGCWGLASEGESIEAHELMHSLGSVQVTAPHATLLGHCTDESDRMCYEDGSTLTLQSVCDVEQEALFDCDKDDYFNPDPEPGNYLATHWNTAASAFLADLTGDVPVSVSGGGTGEGDLDTRAVNFTISLQIPIRQTAKVYYDTTNGTATGGNDYEPVSGVVTFAPGETQKVVSVPVRGDFADEGDEDFLLRIFNPSEAVVQTPFATGTILDDDPKGQGYWLAATDGGIFAFADSAFFGSTGNIRLNQPIVGVAATPSGRGYWLVARDGGIFAFGDARFRGSTGNIRLNEPIVGMAATPSGEGYWLVAADGGVFAFGDANPGLGSTGGRRLDAPIVAMAPTATGNGYWLIGRDGRIFAFGDAVDLGATPRPNQPIVGATATPSGLGLWLAAADGGIFSFGDAVFRGSAGDIRLNKPIVGMARSPSGNGYWLVATDGGIFAFGDAGFLGSTGNIRLNQPIVGMAALRAPLG